MPKIAQNKQDLSDRVIGIPWNSKFQTDRIIKFTWDFEDCAIVNIIEVDTGTSKWKIHKRKLSKSTNKPGKASDFYFVYDTLEDHRKERKITFDEYAVLHILIANIEWQDNYVYDDLGNHMSMRYLAEYIGKSKNTINTICNNLQNKGYIRLEKNNHGSKIYVSALLAWRGYIEEKPNTDFGGKDI